MAEKRTLDLYATSGNSPPSWAGTPERARELASDVARELATSDAWSFHATMMSSNLHLEVEGEVNLEPEVEGGGGSESPCLSARGVRLRVWAGASCTSYVYKRARV